MSNVELMLLSILFEQKFLFRVLIAFRWAKHELLRLSIDVDALSGALKSTHIFMSHVAAAWGGVDIFTGIFYKKSR